MNLTLNLNLTFAMSMNLNLDLVFSKSMTLNLVFFKSMNLNLKIKNKMNGSNPSREGYQTKVDFEAVCFRQLIILLTGPFRHQTIHGLS